MRGWLTKQRPTQCAWCACFARVHRKWKEGKLKEDPTWTLEKEMAKKRGQPLPPTVSHVCVLHACVCVCVRARALACLVVHLPSVRLDTLSLS